MDVALGDAVKLIAKGLNTSRVYEPILTPDQLAALETTPDTEPFDGDPLRFRLSRAYQEGFKGAHKDAMIGLGTAPLDDAMFRSATFEQLGETKLEGAVTTDICGKRDSHATRLDVEATETIKSARLHRKAITAIFFESNGGQAKTDATVPEIRFAVAEPGLDIGNVETALEALTEGCYYLAVERNRYHFSLKENLNKRFADRRATIPPAQVEEQIRDEIQKIFSAGSGLERVYFAEKTIQIADRPTVTLVVLSPDQSLQDEKATASFVENMIREYGTSSRTFKSAVIFCVPESPDTLREDARKVLAWECGNCGISWLLEKSSTTDELRNTCAWLAVGSSFSAGWACRWKLLRSHH